MRAHLHMYPADFTTEVQSGNEITQKSSTSPENGPAMTGPAGRVPAPMFMYMSIVSDYTLMFL